MVFEIPDWSRSMLNDMRRTCNVGCDEDIPRSLQVGGDSINGVISKPMAKDLGDVLCPSASCIMI